MTMRRLISMVGLFLLSGGMIILGGWVAVQVLAEVYGAFGLSQSPSLTGYSAGRLCLDLLLTVVAAFCCVGILGWFFKRDEILWDLEGILRLTVTMFLIAMSFIIFASASSDFWRQFFELFPLLTYRA